MTSNPLSCPLSWTELTDRTIPAPDYAHGPTNAQSWLRLFGQGEAAVRVTLYRDYHAWCPYCQKVWLWLEEKQIPYRVQKVTMFCYGEKEAWYQQKVRSGMLPAVELDDRLITESDEILLALEAEFGPLGRSLSDPQVTPLRRLERLLFRSWCSWLCYPPHRVQERHRQQFIETIAAVNTALTQTPGPYFLEDFSVVDVIFTPFLERINASLFYYKGYSLRSENPAVAAWFEAMETRSTYRGTQSDFHTHVHDLPPQMGGCWANEDPQTSFNQKQVNEGPWLGLPDVGYPEPETSREEALSRVVKHHQTLIRLNPAADNLMDEALRCALTHLITGQACTPPPGADRALRYLRDRICVPRDMSIYAAKRLRESLELTAALAGQEAGPPIPVQHRRDQDPRHFQSGQRLP